MAKHPTNMTAFEEDVLLMNKAVDLTETESKAIKQALENNNAVGVIAGTYDSGLSISFASFYFLKNLGYDYDEYTEYGNVENRSFLNIVYEDDKKIFALDNFQTLTGKFNFRVVTKDGLPLYAHAYKTEFEEENGEKSWLLSVRVSWESIDFSLAKEAEVAKEQAIAEKDAMNQLLQAMTKLVVRFAICDLKNDTYTFYDCGNGAKYESSGTYDQLLDDMGKHLKLLTDTPLITDLMAKEHLQDQLRTSKDQFKFDYAEKDESYYYNMSVVPMEWENGLLMKFVMLAQDITQPKKIELEAQEALREACDAANHANEAKTEFLANMSHDIRTPMNAIIGMTAIAAAHINQKDRVMDSLEKITSASKHLLSLINELLDMSQIEKGNVTLDEDEFNLSELVDNMISIVTPDIESHGHSFEIAIENVEHEHVYGDSLKIQQIFTNIMSNAIKYTPDGGNIRVKISEKPTNHAKIGCYEFVFTDNGIGMSEDFIKVIFDPFSRANNKYVKDMQGTGLGMAITKNIVSMMNGDIKVESKLGEGSKFTVTIFLKLLDVDENNTNDFTDLPVLVVDDDLICCATSVATLNSIGMQGEAVYNGQDAISKTVIRHERNDDYFAIIMDWKMPEMDGIETAREIRRRIGSQVPIIMLSAYDFSEIEQEAREAGIDCFIAKPLFKSRLKNIFRQIANGDHKKKNTGTAIEHIKENNYSNKRILIVEDNDLNREIAVEIVGMTGAMIDTAINGKQAVDLVANNYKGFYDMILMDIQMPVMDGYEATKAIRALEDEKGKDIVIIAMTANAFAEDVIRARNAGFNDHFAKPINLEKLNELLKDGLKK